MHFISYPNSLSVLLGSFDPFFQRAEFDEVESDKPLASWFDDAVQVSDPVMLGFLNGKGIKALDLDQNTRRAA